MKGRLPIQYRRVLNFRDEVLRDVVRDQVPSQATFAWSADPVPATRRPLGDGKIGAWTARVNKINLVLWDEQVWQLWLDLDWLLALWEELPRDSVQSARILKAALEASVRYRNDPSQALAGLLNAGYDAVKAADPNIVVLVHLDRGYDSGLYLWWFSNYRDAGGKWDATAVSFYPYWQPDGTVAQLRANLESLVERYAKPVMVAEIGGPWNDAAGTKKILLEVKALASSTGSRSPVRRWSEGTNWGPQNLLGRISCNSPTP